MSRQPRLHELTVMKTSYFQSKRFEIYIQFFNTLPSSLIYSTQHPIFREEEMKKQGYTLPALSYALLLASSIAHADSVTSVQSQIDILTQQYNALQQQVNSLQAQLVTAQVKITSLSDDISYQSHMVAMLKDSLACVARESDAYTLIFRGCNVVVQNGTGSTITQNGYGNLIIGYNEYITYNPQDGTNNRNGSHNLIIGPEHSYTSVGGFVAGHGNLLLAPHSSILGGNKNRTTGPFTTVAGGSMNDSSNNNASISGGYFNQASGSHSVVSGGVGNKASARYSTVSAGFSNQASGESSSVSGGSSHQAVGQFNWVAGGLVQNQ